ncbi:S53 family peptidase [Streptomyces sp. NPDC004546]
MAVVRTDLATPHKLAPAATPSGYGPADLQSAYNLPSSTAGSGQTIAIVDAYDDPTAEADLAVYRSQYGLPPCTTSNGCFKKIDQNGGTKYPRANGGWAQEISLDLDMVSAVCPNCSILLVEASSNSFANLGTAVNRAAATPGVSAISNSYGGSDAPDATYGSYYNHPGIAVTASSGDGGYGVEYPASSHYVTAVGGTSLTRASNSRGWSETAWSGAGSGCSQYNTALSGQASVNTGCSMRAVADVSAVADPSTGVAVYDSTAYQGRSGWLVFGGTSVSSPIIASVYGLAGNHSTIDNNYPYSHASSLYDVTSGSNGSCTTTQWCNARTGWDGPTGLGTPNGTGAF